MYIIFKNSKKFLIIYNFHPGLFADGCFVIAEGYMEGDLFKVNVLLYYLR